MRSLLRLLLFVLTPVAMAAPDLDPDKEDPKAAKYRALLALCAHPTAGGNRPRASFDCDGLVAYVFKRAWGVALPRRADQQAKLGKRVSRHALEPGDLVFYNTRDRPFSHVGIYIGQDRFVHAPRRGQQIRVDRLDHPYWAARFDGARRLAPPA